MALSQRCTHPEDAFAVSYPAGWHSNSGEVLAPCSAFDPEPIELPRDSEIPFDIAVVVGVEDVPLEAVTRPSRGERILSAERLTIDGREAWRIEVESTGEALAPPGLRSLRYAVAAGGGRTLVASTHATDGADYERNQEILGRMVQSLEIGPTAGR